MTASHHQVRHFRSAVVAAIGALVVGLSACGDAAGSAASGSDGRPQVITTSAPLHFAVGRVGGALVDVTNLAPPGVEAHDLELTARDVAALQEADLVAYVWGITPAVDDAVADLSESQRLEVTSAARLTIAAEQFSDEGSEQLDPHFWLDPTRLADVGDALAAGLTRLDPTNQSTFEANAAALRAELAALDTEFRDGLQECENRTMVTSHPAFAYLAERYDLSQMGIAGISPNNEPNAAQLAEVADFVDDQGVSTIYVGSSVDPGAADVVASETGAALSVLDPLETVADGDDTLDYFTVMRANLQSLQSGQRCT
jgi:zinc transport system substrate-binding protein